MLENEERERRHTRGNGDNEDPLQRMLTLFLSLYFQTCIGGCPLMYLFWIEVSETTKVEKETSLVLVKIWYSSVMRNKT